MAVMSRYILFPICLKIFSIFFLSAGIAASEPKWIQVCDFNAFDSPAALDYAVESIPSNVLIRCSDGQIVATQLRGRELAIRLEELLGK